MMHKFVVCQAISVQNIYRSPQVQARGGLCMLQGVSNYMERILRQESEIKTTSNLKF